MRKLAITAFSFSAAIFAANYLIPLSWLFWLGSGFLGCALLLLLARRRWMILFVLSLFGLAAGCFCYAFHAQRTTLQVLSLDGETEEIRAQVLEYPRVYEEYCRVEVRLTGETLSGLNGILYANGDTLKDVCPGDIVSCSARLRRADQRYGERYDQYLSRDLYLVADAKSEPMVEKSGFRLRFLPVKVNHAVGEKVDELFPADTAAFMKSLMLGDKSDLYSDKALHLSLTRSGFSHIVAVSGMHIAFLVGLIQLLLGKRPLSSVICLLLVWFFIFVTGSPPSAVRAGIMQSFLLLAPLVQRENDPATSLSAALALILLQNPFAASSVGLQLSFAAMAGILCLSEPISEAIQRRIPEAWAERLRGVIATAASSAAVMVFTLPLSALHFRAITLLSPISNVLGLWAVSLCFCGGFLSCLFGFAFPVLGKAFAWLVSWPVRYLFLIAKAVSSVSFSTVYIKDALPALWLVLVYCLFLAAFFSKLRFWKKLLIPTALSALSLALLLGVVQREYRSGGIISVMDVGQGQCIGVMSGDKTLVIDCGSLYTLQNAGETAGQYLRACGREQIDVLILTHLHADHCNGAAMLMEMLPVRQLILPEDVPDEDQMLEEILASAQRHGTEVLFVDQDMAFTLGGIRAQLYAPGEKGEANERCLMAVASLGEYDMLVTGDSNKSTEKELIAKHEPHDMELLIVGHHGSRYASSGELLDCIGADTAVISVGYNTFGHPTYETLERLAAYGYTVYRTDLNGTVEIRLEAQNG